MKPVMSVLSIQKALATVGLYTGALDGIYGKKTATAIVKLQQLLRGFGVYKGRNTGKYDSKVRDAVIKWQRIHPPLIPDGIIGPLTMLTLVPTYTPTLRTNKSHNIKKSKATGREYPREAEAGKYYGHVGRHQKSIKLPYPMRIAWAPEKVVKTTMCHELVAEDFVGIMEDTLSLFGFEKIQQMHLDLYGGSLMVRPKRGGHTYSMHAYGAATDWNPTENGWHVHRPQALFSKPEYIPFWDIVEHHGATSLGLLKNYDYMHFQWAWR